MDPTVAAIIWWGVGFWCGVAVCVALFKYRRRPKSKGYYDWGG